MYRFFESIKSCKGISFHLDLHEDRMNRTRRDFFGSEEKISLAGILHPPDTALLKCRVIYGEQIEQIEFLPYFPRKIEYLQIVPADSVSYSYKFLDRSSLIKLLDGIPANTELLLLKDGLITDSTFANVVFWDGSSWLTPDKPLLAGTKRQYLLDQQIIRKKKIRPEDLKHFHYAVLINAMLDLEDSNKIEIKNIL
jgi:4-amino-4-deoxychorismate lyase